MEGPGWLDWSREEGWQMGILGLGVDLEGGNELGLRALGQVQKPGLCPRDLWLPRHLFVKQ